jgi:hypothetical protein
MLHRSCVASLAYARWIIKHNCVFVSVGHECWCSAEWHKCLQFQLVRICPGDHNAYIERIKELRRFQRLFLGSVSHFLLRQGVA